MNEAFCLALIAAHAIAENSRLSAMITRTTPVVESALELRRMGLALETYHAEYDERRASGHMLTRSYTVALMMENSFEVSLKDFDAKVREAALSEFAEFQRVAA